VGAADMLLLNQVIRQSSSYSHESHYTPPGSTTNVKVAVNVPKADHVIQLAGSVVMDTFSEFIERYNADYEYRKEYSDAYNKQVNEDYSKAKKKNEEERQAKIEEAKESIRALARTYQRDETFWKAGVSEDDAMYKAREVMKKRNPDLLSLADGCVNLWDEYYEVTFSHLSYRYKNADYAPWASEINQFLDAAKQFPEAIFNVPINLINAARGWSP
jgi:hypothetical protein